MTTGYDTICRDIPRGGFKVSVETDQHKAVDRDAELMVEFKAGRREAFDELVRRNLGSVHSLIFRFMRNESHVDDLTQETFLRIYRHAESYQPTAKFSTWLYRIVANLCFNALRAKKLKRTCSLDNSAQDSSIELPDTAQRSPSEEVNDEELGRIIKEEICALPENQRMAIILKQYEQLNYDEIADVMETSPSAVKSLLSRARTTLRTKLGRYLTA